MTYSSTKFWKSTSNWFSVANDLNFLIFSLKSTDFVLDIIENIQAQLNGQ